MRAPAALPVRPDSVPLLLRERPQWVLWRYGQRGSGSAAKWTKPLFQPDGRFAAVDRPQTWRSFEVILAAYQRRRDYWSGIGFVLTPEIPLTIVGVDIDHCIGSDGALDRRAFDVISALDTYTELSPSANGVHVFALSEPLPAGRRRTRLAGDNAAELEVYDGLRYLSITGHHLPWTPSQILARQTEVGETYDHLFGVRNALRGGAPPLTDIRAPQSVWEDIDVIAMASKDPRRGTQFTRLWSGDFTGYINPQTGLPDHSAADLALCNDLVYWSGADAARVDRLFRSSGLFRPKWDERRGRLTYGERTIRLAMERITPLLSQR